MSILSVQATTLRKATLFSGYSDKEFAAIRQISKSQSFAAGAVLFEENEPCSAVYFVETGLVKLYLAGSKNREQIVEFIYPGDTCAEAAMFSGHGYPVSAKAVDDTQVIAVNAYQFSQFLRTHPHLTWKMLGVMSRRLHHLVGEIRSLSLHNAEQKVAGYLLRNIDPELPEHCVARPITNTKRSALASHLGVTPETLCRVLTHFRKRGWISVDDRLITIADPGSLESLMRTTAPPTSH